MEKGDEAQEWQGEKTLGEGGRNGEKGYQKEMIIFLFICAAPGTPASR